MVRIDRLREDSEKRILRCSEGKSIWYQIWIDPGDMMRIEPLLEGGNRLWCIEIQKYYVFFYEVRNGRRIIGKNKIKEIGYELVSYESEPYEKKGFFHFGRK